jgi:glycosyltransferase involved in cell wall biosynthesis
MGTEISVIIPAYNEEDNISGLYSELNEILNGMGRSFETVFIDDGSTDSTFQKILELQTNNPNIKIIKFRRNFGQSAAMKAGFDHASGKLIVTMDCDLQNDPHDIPLMISKLENEDFDVVCGWRFNRNDPFFKRFFSKIANTLRTFLTNESIHDSGCTLRVYKKECVEDLELFGELHRYIPALLLWTGYKIGEETVNHRSRAYGKTKYSWTRVIKGFLDLLGIAFWQKYSLRPMHIFGGTGLIMGIIGLVVVLWLGFSRLLYGTSLTERPLFMVGIFLLIVGTQFVASGILADIMLKVYYGQKTRKNYLVEKML